MSDAMILALALWGAIAAYVIFVVIDEWDDITFMIARRRQSLDDHETPKMNNNASCRAQTDSNKDEAQ